MSPKIKLPQYFRRIPAYVYMLKKNCTNITSSLSHTAFKRLKLPQWLAGFTLILLCLMCVVNIFSPVLLSPTKESKLREELLQSGDNSRLHEELGSYYLSINGLAAKREYTIAQELYVPESTASISPLSRFNTFFKKRTDLIKEKYFWENLQKKYPEYSYINLKLAEINLRLGNTVTSKEYLVKARTTNPYDSRLKLLEKTWGL